MLLMRLDRLGQVSLKTRLRVVLCSFLVLAIFFSSALLFKQHQIAQQAREIARSAQAETNHLSIDRMADSLRRDQERAVHVTALALLLFILLIVFTTDKIIRSMTQPLSLLVNYLDGVDMEKDLPQRMPDFGTNIREVSHVARSFEQLLHRLRGYRALNIKRLLLEKRRADVIAASTSDGIFLLRESEILYVNPIGERILGIRSPIVGMESSSQSGINLHALASSGGEGSRGAKALLEAISRTIPVEVCFEQEDRRLYYLIRSFPISFEAIDQVDWSFNGPSDRVLDKFQANTLIVAQDVTIVRESHEAKSHFLGTLSHEVKTPVTSLTMATRLLRKSVAQIPNPTHRSLIMTCAEDVDRLRTLLDDLLNVSRFETLTQRIVFQNVDIGKLLKHAIQSFQMQAQEKEIDLISKIQHQGSPLIISVDPTKISWAISNLLTNALRHTPRLGKIVVTMTAHDESVEVKIQDTGPGMDRKRQMKVFEKFTSFYDIRIGRSGSVGVGLAIAREIVGAHGGRIWVSSEIGQGAEFGFTLPLKCREFGDEVDCGEQSKSISTNDWSSMKGASSGTSARGG